MPVEKFYSVKEMCALLGISETTLWRLRKEGKIDCVRVRNRPKFPASYIEAYQQRLMGGTPHQAQALQSSNAPERRAKALSEIAQVVKENQGKPREEVVKEIGKKRAEQMKKR